MRFSYAILLFFIVFHVVSLVTTGYADEALVLKHAQQHTVELGKGDLKNALGSLRACHDALLAWKLDRVRPMIRNCEIEIADLESTLELPDEDVREISAALRQVSGYLQGGDEKPLNARAELIARYEASKQAHACLADHLPLTSPLRMRMALQYSVHARRDTDRKDLRALIEEYYKASVREHGPEFIMSICLEMDLALIDILGEDPEPAYHRIRELLFSEDPDKVASHFYPRMTFAREFIFVLHWGDKWDWIHDSGPQVLEFYSPRLLSIALLSDFALIGEIMLDIYERRQQWQFAAAICRTMLEQRELHGPEVRQQKLHFLRGLHQALIHLEENEEAAQVAAKLAEAERNEPIRRSRYTED